MGPDRLTLTMALASVLVAWSTESLAQTDQPAPPAPPPRAPLAPPPVPPPPAVNPAPSEYLSLGGDWRFGFHGLAGVSLYVQDTPGFLFNGQGPLLPLTKPASGYTTGADVRQSRFAFSVAGPRVLGAIPKAVLEIDLFGLDSPGDYGEVSAYERLRLAYAELNWKNDTLRFGQDTQVIFPMIPDSIGHLAFPVTYTAGMIGWREPGIGYFHKIPFGDSDLELALQVMKSDWQSPYGLGAFTNENEDVDLGQLSGLLGVEGRVKFTSEHLMAFAAGHFNRVMGSHQADLPTPLNMNPVVYNRNWDVWAGVAGVKVMVEGLSLTASGYYGQNLAPMLGEQLQFYTYNDIREWGAWGEAMYAFGQTWHLDVAAIGGTSRLNPSDLETVVNMGQGGGSAALSNTVMGGMVRFRIGGFAIGPEFYHVIAKRMQPGGTGAPSGAGAPDGILADNQLMLSGMYLF